MKYLPHNILALKKQIRQNNTLIRRSRKAKSFKKVIQFQDTYYQRTQEFRELAGFTNSVIPEVHGRPKCTP